MQDKYPIWENIVLVEAELGEKALREADRIGKSYYDDTENPDEEQTWEGRPADWVFAGTRKVIEITETVSSMEEEGEPWIRPGRGTEISYSQMEVDSEEGLLKLVDGDPVIILYEQ